MLFNSVDFLVYFPIVVLLFFIIPKRLRTVWLLIASYYFYMSWNPEYAVLIGISTVITFLSGIFIARSRTTSGKKAVVAVSLISNLAILGVFKYANFVLGTIDTISQSLGHGVFSARLDILLPVGISFYTFQALSYTIDVYRGKIAPEKNILNYALFVSFFPQLVAGPIERSGNLLSQIQNIKKIKVFDYERIKSGLLLMAWGFFMKLVIADRASIILNQTYNNYKDYGFLELAIATVCFAFQVYCDFAGYTAIARGAARVMGFELMENFRQPYLACSIKELWRRWHISLTTWFTDYLYIPLGGNRKGQARKYLNIVIVFGVSGLWHGANWHYVVWGLLHAVYQLIEDLGRRMLKKRQPKPAKKRKKPFALLLVQVLITFALTCFAYIFFAANDVPHAIGIIGQMGTGFMTTGLLSMGVDRINLVVLIIGLVILTIVDLIRENGVAPIAWLQRRIFVVRWIFYVAFIWFILMFGVYGAGYDTSQFIYFQF